MSNETSENQDRLVSIILVSHNRPEMLARALDSIFSQAYRPIEIVLVDNQSDPPIVPPATPDGITIKLCKTESYTNASVSRNFGIAQSSGRFIGFLDDDDYYLPGNITRQMEVLESEQDVDIVYMNTITYGPNGKEMMVLSGTPDWPIMIFIHLNGLMVRRHVAVEEPFEETITKDIDDHFVIRIFERYAWKHIPETGAVWLNESRPDQITFYTYSFWAKFRNLNQKYLNSKIMCEDFADKIDCLDELRIKYYRRQSQLSLITFRPIESLRYWMAARGRAPGPREKTAKRKNSLQ